MNGLFFTHVMLGAEITASLLAQPFPEIILDLGRQEPLSVVRITAEL